MKVVTRKAATIAAVLLVGLIVFSCANPNAEVRLETVELPLVPATLNLQVDVPPEYTSSLDTLEIRLESDDGHSPIVRRLSSWSNPISVNNIAPGRWIAKVKGFQGGIEGSLLFESTVTISLISGSNATTVAASPSSVSPVSFSPNGGNVPQNTQVQLSCGIVGSSIHYTTDGSDPTESSPLYSSPITLSDLGNVTIKARGYKTGLAPSPIAQAIFTVSSGTTLTSPPSISPQGGNFQDNVVVSLSGNGTIYYTINGSDPTESSPVYSAPLSLTSPGTYTIRARAKETGKEISATASATFNLTQASVSAPVFNPISSSIQATTNISITSATLEATIFYTTDGSDPTSSSTRIQYVTPFTLPIGSHTIKAYAVKSGHSPSTVTTQSYTVQPAVQGIRIHVFGYTKIHIWNAQPAGSYPNTTWPGTNLTAEGDNWFGISYPNATSLNIVFNTPASGTSLPNQTADLSRTTGEWWYKNGQWTDSDPDVPPIPIISASPDPTKKYNTAQTVTLTSTSSQDEIFYTLDGSTPTVNSTKYTSPLTLNSSSSPQTIKALGRNRLNQVGQVYSFTYDINTNHDLDPPNITASQNPGGYPSAITVQFTISDNRNGVTAYYTTDGSSPTTNSPVYATTTGTSTSGALLNVSANTRFRFLVRDSSGNTTEQSFNYFIGQMPRGDFREETIYFLMTTRFYDGDPSNNFYCWDDQKAGNVANNDPAWRGDFKGLIEKLDYIKALGFSAIWITPVVKNMSGYDYHGYHAVNHSVVDPRYESPGYDYQKLIDEAHARGIKIIQDVVINHTGNFGEENLHPIFQKDANGSYLNWLNPNQHVANSLLEQAAQQFGGTYASLTPGNQFQARIRTLRAPLDVNVHYHNHNFQGGWEQYEVQLGSIAGDCQDLNTENPTVAEYLRNAYINYINMGVDAFRVDTVKHISRLTFNREFIPQWKQAGGQNFYIFGEVATRYRSIWNDNKPAISTPFYTWKWTNNKWDSDYPWGNRTTNEAQAYQHWLDNQNVGNQPSSDNHLLLNNTYRTPDWSKRSGLDVIDFPMHWAFNSVQDAWNTAVGGDWAYSDATFNVTYVDSHDYAPDTAPENKRYTGSWPEKLSLIFTFRGIPTIYYGTEIEFKKGAVIDVGPNAPLENTGRAYFGNHITGSVTVSDFGRYSNATGNMATTLSHPLAKHIRALNLIRRAVPALQKGQYSTQNVSGAMAFRRRYTGTMNNGSTVDSFALVALDGTATFSNVPNGTYRDVVTGQTHTVSNGSATLSANGLGNVRVWVLYGGANQPDPGHVLQGMFPLEYIK